LTVRAERFANWGKEAFGLPFHDNWWQTETGGIMIANFACMDIKPGSMGRPLPGIEAEIVRKNEDGHFVITARLSSTRAGAQEASLPR
jgi:acyl-coenzyme A synthetase/AMP-(fatty) acid ligase